MQLFGKGLHAQIFSKVRKNSWKLQLLIAAVISLLSLTINQEK